MYRLIAILLIPALLMAGCARAETDSYIQVIVPEGGGYEAAVTPRPAAPSPTASPTLNPSEAPEAALAPQPAAPPTAAPKQAASPTPTARPSASPTAEPAVILKAADGDYNSGILELVNQYRKQTGLNSLKYSGKLQKAADVRAREIVTLFDHTRPDGSNCSTAVTESGISFSAFGENIFMCSGVTNLTSKLIFDAWMDSPSHRENILREGFTDMCIGIYSADGSTYAVQLFGAGLS